MPVEARYYGPYEKLPNYAMIEGSFAFFLAPQAVPDEYFPHDALVFIAFLVVFNKDQKPILFAMIQNDGLAQSQTRFVGIAASMTPALIITLQSIVIRFFL